MPNASISDVILYHHCYVFHVSKGEHFSHFLATQINLTLQLCFWDTLNPDTIQQQNQGLTHAYLGYLSSGIQVIILVIIPYHNSNSVQLDTWNTVWMFILDLKKCNKGNKDKCTLHIDEKKIQPTKKTCRWLFFYWETMKYSVVYFHWFWTALFKSVFLIISHFCYFNSHCRAVLKYTKLIYFGQEVQDSAVETEQ